MKAGRSDLGSMPPRLAGLLFEDPLSHERGSTGRRVGRGRDRMLHAAGPADNGYARRQRDRPAKYVRAANDGQQAASIPVISRQLVHEPARSAHDPVFGSLAEAGKFGATEPDSRQTG